MRNLPEPCDKCRPDGGYWLDGKRCDCARGLALIELSRRNSEPPICRQPVLDETQVTILTEMMASIAFFPGETGARTLIGAEIRDMAESFEQASDFVRRFGRLYKRWPGASEVRWAFCQMGFEPLDAIAPAVESEHYPDGLPAGAGGRQQIALLETAHNRRSRELPPGEDGALIRSLAELRRL